jgi:hypothetical protein
LRIIFRDPPWRGAPVDASASFVGEPP